MPSSRPRLSPVRDLALEQERAAQELGRLGHLAGRRPAPGCGSTTRSPRRPPPAARRGSRTRSAAGTRGCPWRPCRSGSSPPPRRWRRPAGRSARCSTKSSALRSENSRSNGMTTSSSTPRPAIRSRLIGNGMTSFGVASGRSTDIGWGSKVRTVSLPRITSRWPRCTPSKVPIATLRGGAGPAGSSGSRQAGDLHGRTLRRAAARGPAARRWRSARPRASAARARPSALARAAATPWATSRRLVGVQRALGQEGQRPRAGHHRVGVGVLDREGADGGAPQLLAVGVAERRRRAGARRCRPSIRSRTSAVSPSRQSGRARWTVTGRCSPSMRLSPARLLVQRLAADLHRRVGGRALHAGPGGNGGLARARARCARACRRGRRCPRSTPAAPRRGRSSAAPSGSAAPRVARPTSTSSRPVANGSSVPACPTFVLRGNSRRTAATTSWEVLPAGLSTGSPRSTGASISGSELVGDQGADLGHQLVGRELGRGARRLAVSAAAQRAGDHRHVHGAVGGAQAHLAAAVAVVGQQLAHQHGDLRALDGAQVVHDPLRVGLQRARLLEVGRASGTPSVIAPSS